MMKTKRFAAVLAAMLAFACCAAAWGDMLPRSRREPLPPERQVTLSDNTYMEATAEVGNLRALNEQDKELIVQIDLILHGPGEYEYAVYEKPHYRAGAEVTSAKGAHEKYEERRVPVKFRCITPVGENTFRLEGSFTPYLYQKTDFGPKLIAGPDGNPVKGEQQPFVHIIQVREPGKYRWLRLDPRIKSTVYF